jgi:hypothetical protein
MPEFDNAVRACGGANEEADACASGDEMCIPDPPAAGGLTLCIYREGLLSCPADYPNEQALVYTSFQDTRSCPESCSCSAQGGDCSSTMNVYGVFDCGGGANSVNVGTSGQTCLTSGSALIPFGVAVDPEPVCTPDSSTTTATGQVTGADPITVCCSD